jgi:predicted dehydrogenase
MGSVHASQYAKMPEVELAAYDRNAEKLARYCERTGARPMESYDALTAWADVVDVCLPTDLHLEHGLRAIAAGRAVFMEKPMASDLAGCEALIEAAAKACAPLMPGHVVRFFPEYEAAHRQVVSGQIGEPAAARLRRGGRAPKGSDDWFLDRQRSGGVLLDLAIHDFDWLRWTLGEAKSVYARSVIWTGAGAGGADYALTTLSLASGAVAHVESTWMDPSGFRTALEVCGRGGMIEHDSRWTGVLRTHTPDGSVAESPMACQDDPYYREIRGFLDAVASGGPVPVPPEDGLAAVRLSLAAVRSAREGRVVEV